MVNGQTTSFSYDAAGIRVKLALSVANVTIKPGGTIIDHPFPGYEVENPTGTPIIRRTYFIAGQTIATRITGHPVGANNGLFFFYSDHPSVSLRTSLGSTSMLHKSGQSVPFTGSTTRYLPFGGYRGTAPSQAITDRDFTGQRENMELGLLYYNARYYLPGVGRFISADTLVPNPTNPQSLNRYSYVRNSPLNFTDPTGHRECADDSYCDPPTATPTSPPDLVTFTGVNGQTWTDAEKSVVKQGSQDIANTLAQTINGNRWAAAKLGEGTYSRISATSAFFAFYGGTVNFHKTGTDPYPDKTVFAEWKGNNTIHVYTDIYKANGESKIPIDYTGSRWAVHELGHGVEAHINDVLGSFHVRNQIPGSIANRDGFAGPHPGWQQSTCTIDCNGEIFADMVVGWTYGQWDTGEYLADAKLKDNFMTTNMSVWVGIVAP